jgi:hypothetical protein
MERGMQANEAVEIAKRAIVDLFGSDGVAGLRLEEIERGGDGIWSVTIGFVRPMALAGTLGQASSLLADLKGEAPLGPRVYRVVRLRDLDGEVLSVKIREGLD